MKADCTEVRELISALTRKVLGCRQSFRSGESQPAMLSLRFRTHLLRFLLFFFFLSFSSGSELGMALYGCRKLTSDSTEVKRLVSSLAEKVKTSSEKVWTAQSVSNALFGLQNIKSNSPEALGYTPNLGHLEPKLSQVNPHCYKLTRNSYPKSQGYFTNLSLNVASAMKSLHHRVT